MEVLRTATLPMVRDGALEQMIDEGLAEIYEDCSERPRLTKPRKIVIELEFRPMGDEMLEAVDFAASVNTTIPKQTLRRPLRAVTRSRGFGFETDTDSIQSAEGQQTFPYDTGGQD